MSEFSPTDPPRDISIEEDDRSIYETLSEQNDSPFQEAELNEIFVFAASYGYNQGLRLELDSKRALANRQTLSDEQRWILRSIAINEVDNRQILQDKKQIYIIAEEYAKGGIEQLSKLADRPDDLDTVLSTEMIEIGQRYGDE